MSEDTSGLISPYQGLTPFTENLSEFFFGREREIRILAANLRAIPMALRANPAAGKDESIEMEPLTPEGANPLVQVVPFVLILGIFYFIILLPSKKKQQKVQAFLESLKVNDRIVMTNGIHGQITRLGDQSVQVQIADKVRIEVSKAAIGGYQGQPQVVESTPE